MALITCKDCNNEVSDSANACPKCGAPVTKVLYPDEIQCPFCMHTMHKDAITCGACGAEYGYYISKDNKIYNSKKKLVNNGIILPIIITVVVLSIHTYAGYGVGLLMFFVIINVIIVLKKGKRWWKTRGL